MVVGENRHKVTDIVAGQAAQLKEMYAPAIDRVEGIELLEGNGFVRDLSPVSVATTLAKLPRELRFQIARNQGTDVGTGAANEGKSD
jgi:hypothetical protein